MKRTIFAITCLLLGSTAAQSAEFIGALKVLTGSAGCNDGWNPVGGEFNGHLYPFSANPSDNYSQFAIFDRTLAMSAKISKGNFSAKLVNAATTVIGRGTSSFSSKIAFVSQVPTKVSATTKFVNVNGKIVGFDDNPDCTITFRYSGVLRQ